MNTTDNNIVALPTGNKNESNRLNFELVEMVILHDKKAVTNSLKVAEIFNREHKSVLRSIQNLECSEDFNRRNFAPISYLDSYGREQTAIEMTKDGFVILAMGFTGEKAMQFKEAYIAEFNRMEKQLYRLKHLARPKTPQDIFYTHHRTACLLLKDANQRLRYANELTLAETGVDVMAHALTFRPAVLKDLLNTQFGNRTIQQLLDSVHYQFDDHVQAEQLLLSQFIMLKKGVLVVGTKCPLVSDRVALRESPSATYKTAHFKGTGAVKATLIPLY